MILILWNYHNRKTRNMNTSKLGEIVSAIVRSNAEKKSRAKQEHFPESAKLPPQRKKTPPPKLLLAGITKSIPKAESAESARSNTPPTKEKKKYSKYNFPLINDFLKEFLKIHQGINVFLGERMEGFFQKLDEKFFQWLNHQKNSEKMIYDIKKEFMNIADILLLYEVMNEQYKQTYSGFIIGPFQQILANLSEETPDNPFIPINFTMSNDPIIQPYSRSLQQKPLAVMNDYESLETNSLDSLILQSSDLSENLLPPPIPDLDDTYFHIFEMEMDIAGISDISGTTEIAEMNDMADIGNYFSSFFND